MKDFNFDDIYTDLLLRKQAKSEEYKKTHPLNIENISPSKAGYCLRKQYFEDMMPQKIDEMLLKIFAHGNLIHDKFAYEVLREYYEDELHSKNMSIINEFPFKKEYENFTIKGFIDDLIMLYTDNGVEFIPIEIKSIGNKFYKLKEPLPEHKVQLNLYLKIMNAEFGFIVYISKSDLSTKTFKMERDEIEEKNIFKRLNTLANCRKNGIIPEAEGLIKQNTYEFATACKYCKYKEMCLNMPKEEVNSK